MLGIQSFLCPRQLPEGLFTALIITWDPFQKDPLVFQVVRHGLSRQVSSRAAATAQTRAGRFTSMVLSTKLSESLASQTSEYRNDEFGQFVSLVNNKRASVSGGTQQR
jgi:hypothetical protein